MKPLATLGVDTLDDLRWVSEQDLKDIGMKIVEIRKLRAAYQAKWMWTPWNGTLFPEHMQVGPMLMGTMEVPATGGPAGTQLPSLWELQRLQDALNDAELKALISLETACDLLEVALAVEENQEVIKSAMAARRNLLDSSRTTGLAIHAENATVRALSKCCKGEARNALAEAERSIRDAIVLRAQMGVPLGSRQIFVKTLEDAYGGDMPRNTLSRLMHAHGKTVCPLFEHAFVSKSRQENAKRNQGPRGKRSRDAKRQASAAEDEDEDKKDEDEDEVEDLPGEASPSMWFQGPLGSRSGFSS